MSSGRLLAHTARWAAAHRARESERVDRLFADPLARALAGDEGMAILQHSEQSNPQRDSTATYVALRTRFCDDVALHATNEGVRQVVVVAAGMDARAFRLHWPEGTRLYELDQQELLHLKEEILHREQAQPRCQRVGVGVDLNDAWTGALEAAGFHIAEPSVWIVEGFLYYLEEPQVGRLRDQIGDCAAAGSSLGADLVSASFFTSPWTQMALEMLAANGMPWRFGTDDPELLFAGHGWYPVVTTPGGEGANYGRWTFPVLPRERRELPHSFLVRAERASMA
jgi:methyltransferase (TIGR00027 family)